MLVNLGLTGYSRTAIGGALLLLTACSALILWRKQDEILSFWREHRHLILVNEVLFLLFFGLFLLIRYGNPDLWHPIMGGEKPMDLAYLNAVIRSSVFPPYDPWFAGGYLNYYYYGQIIVATLIKFTGIVPWVGYNLTIPLWAALTAMGAFSVTYNLTRGEGAQRKKCLHPALGKWWEKEFLWGVLAALFVAVLGNLGEIGVLLKALQDMSQVDPKSSIPIVRETVRVLSGAVQWLTGRGKPGIRPEWPYWNPSRIMPHGEINEFPFFTFLYADLHAHLIALPFGLLALGMAVGIVRQKRRPGPVEEAKPASEGEVNQGSTAASESQPFAVRARHVWHSVSTQVDWGEVVLLAVVALVVGALRCINSWDYPTYLLVVGVAFVLRELERRGRDLFSTQGLWAVAWRSGLVFLLSNAFFWPFLTRFATAYVSFERWKGPRTGLDAYLVIHGLFLWCIVSWMGAELFGREARQGATRMLRLAARYWDLLPRMLGLYDRLVQKGREYDTLGWVVVVPMGLLLLLLALSKQWFFLFVLLLILGTLLIVLRWRLEPRRRFTWLLFGLGLLLTLGVDLFVLKGDIGRMNTVFKFYLQVWVFWAIAAAFALSELAERSPCWPAQRQQVWWGMFALLFCLAALYPIWASRAKIYDRFDTRVGPTLDGMAYMKRAIYYDNGPLELKWDYDAINWLLDNVQGSPVIAEGNADERGLYRWGSRISIYTGMPTIAGWSWHQRQQGRGDAIDRRIRDVHTLYRDPDINVAWDILNKYEVRYVYVGEMERNYYPGPGLDKFEVMRAQGLLNLVYHNERVQIYEVVRHE